MRPGGADSVAIIASAREATRSNDTHYRYRQDSDFYYLTGFTEPERAAVRFALKFGTDHLSVDDADRARA